MQRLLGVLISIHALLAESDDIEDLIRKAVDDFYPRSPCGERRRECSRYITKTEISIHALLAESDIPGVSERLYTDISIHALLAESDC